MNSIRIATRNSPLARYQAERVGSLLANSAGVRIELLGMTTQGDRQSGSTFSGKGAFVKELEIALLEGRADIAVHSMKDVPVALPEGLAVTTVGARADVRDALIAGDSTFDTLPEGARVGSSSLRRRLQLRFVRPDLTMMDMRGNVGTRLRKLDDGEVDALILACAGLDRLGLLIASVSGLPWILVCPHRDRARLPSNIRRIVTMSRSMWRPLSIHWSRRPSSRSAPSCARWRGLRNAAWRIRGNRGNRDRAHRAIGQRGW